MKNDLAHKVGAVVPDALVLVDRQGLRWVDAKGFIAELQQERGRLIAEGLAVAQRVRDLEAQMFQERDEPKACEVCGNTRGYHHALCSNGKTSGDRTPANAQTEAVDDGPECSVTSKDRG